MTVTVTVPDRRSDTDPNKVIDPSLVKDSTAGLQTFLDSTPAGSTVILPFDLLVNGTIEVKDRRILTAPDPMVARSRLVATNVYPWRVWPDRRKTINGKANPAYNPDGICAPWQYDLTGSVKNPYGRPKTAGEWGGYDGTTGASGVDYDGIHLSTRATAPFLPKHRGMGVKVMAYAGFNKNITRVSTDGKTVYFNNNPLHDPPSQHEDTTHTCAWAIQPMGGWGKIFTPNPAWQPQWIFGKYWHNYEEALRLACVANRGVTQVVVRDTSQLIGIEAEGPNATWGQSVISLDQSWPVVSEFQHGISVEAKAIAYLCESHHHYGDGFAGPGRISACRSIGNGRHGMVGHYDDKVIEGCVIDLARRASIDFELSSGKPTYRPTVRNTCLGNHGISYSTPIIDGVFDGLHSTKADVAAGRITSTTMIMRGASHGGGGGSRNVTYKNCVFDAATRYFITAQGIDGLHVHNCRADVNDGSYFVRPWYKQVSNACKNVDVSGNDGGPKLKGQVEPIT